MRTGLCSGGKWLLGALLLMLCLACQPGLVSAPPPPPPPPPAAPEQPAPHPTVYVKVARLNLRAGPGMDFPKIGLIERNEELEKLGQTEDWVQVRVKRDRSLGWVASEYLSASPVAAPLETAAPEPPGAPAPAAKEPSAAEPKRPKPAKVETVVPRAPKPAEAAEPPAPKARPKPAAEAEAEPAPSPEPKAAPAKPAPVKEEPAPPAAPAPDEDQPSRIRIM
jgi:hypothetical protein